MKKTNLLEAITLLIIALLVLTSTADSAEVEGYVIKKPVFISISVDKTKIKAGDRLLIYVDAREGSSPLTDGIVMWSSPSGKELYSDLSYNSSTGKLEGAITVNKYAEPGLWECIFVKIGCEKGEIATSGLADDLTAANIIIENEYPDLSPPELLDITTGPNRVKPGDTLKVSIKATDELSGLNSGFITWQASGSDTWTTIILSLNPGTGYLEGTIRIADESIPGLWKVNAVRITDNVGNELFIGAGSSENTIFKNASFVVTDFIDPKLIVPPIITSPSSGDIKSLGIVDEKPKKPGIQITISGTSLPYYGIELIFEEKVIARTNSSSDGLWSAEITVLGPISEIKAIAVLSNGVRSLASSPIRLDGFKSMNFSDVRDNDWHRNHIYDLAIRGIVNGYEGRRYKPLKKVTLGEFSKMICIARDFPFDQSVIDQDSENKTAHWAYPYITTLKNKGILDAKTFTNPVPDKELTRAEVAKIVVEAATLELDTTSTRFPDIIGHWASNYILTCKKHKILSGYNDGTFHPQGTMTRAEAAKVIWSILTL